MNREKCEKLGTNFWKNTKILLKVNHMTQTELANFLNVGQRTFQDWVYSKRTPDIDASKRIADRLNTTIDFLITGKEFGNQSFSKELIEFVGICKNLEPNYLSMMLNLAQQLENTQTSQNQE